MLIVTSTLKFRSFELPMYRPAPVWELLPLLEKSPDSKLFSTLI